LKEFLYIFHKKDFIIIILKSLNYTGCQASCDLYFVQSDDIGHLWHAPFNGDSFLSTW